MPETETSNSGTETLSDREFLERLAVNVQGMAGMIGTLLQLQETDRKQLDHVDTMTHEILQFIEENRPALARATALLGKARAWQGWAGTRKTGTEAKAHE